MRKKQRHRINGRQACSSARQGAWAPASRAFCVRASCPASLYSLLAVAGGPVSLSLSRSLPLALSLSRSLALSLSRSLALSRALSLALPLSLPLSRSVSKMLARSRALSLSLSLALTLALSLSRSRFRSISCLLPLARSGAGGRSLSCSKAFPLWAACGWCCVLLCRVCVCVCSALAHATCHMGACVWARKRCTCAARGMYTLWRRKKRQKEETGWIGETSLLPSPSQTYAHGTQGV
jgi:hypothetical protein